MPAASEGGGSNASSASAAEARFMPFTGHMISDGARAAGSSRLPAVSDPDPVPLLRLRGIRKAYPGVVALDGVDFDLRAGEVHVLLGENGAGKSTFVRILSGATTRDAGEIEVDGRAVEIGGPREAQRLGISAIYQEFNLVPQLSAAQNIFLGREPSRGGVLDRRRLVAEAGALLEGLGVRLDPRTPVQSLGVAQQQMVEVAKALSTQARVLIMDEPTSALTESEIRELFAAMRGLTRARGRHHLYFASHGGDRAGRRTGSPSSATAGAWGRWARARPRCPSSSA